MTHLSCDAVGGAGFAGAATSHHLVRVGLREVVVLEQEPLAGVHASGRNAGMIREAVLPPAIQPLAREGAAFIRKPPSDLDPAPKPPPLRRPDAGRRGPGEVEARVPATTGGACVLTSHRVLHIVVENGKVAGVETDRASFATPLVVNAADAWASELRKAAGAAPLSLRPCRRHLYVSGRLDWVEPSWPIVWDLSHALSFRPEPPGLLLSPCDETEQTPGPAATDAAVSEALATKLARYVPRLAALSIARSWAGLRTLSPDGSFMVGRDPILQGFVWCAGLGGHGVTVGPAVGRLAAEAALGRPCSPAHSPERFIGSRRPAADAGALAVKR